TEPVYTSLSNSTNGDFSYGRAPHLHPLEEAPMAAPRWLARFNRRVTNHITGPVAPHLPGFGVVLHSGRTTHRRYRTPVNVLRRPSGFVVALTYGRDSSWVRNVLANGGRELVTRGRTWRLTQPHLVHDERHRFVPAPARLVLSLIHADDFLELSRSDAATN